MSKKVTPQFEKEYSRMAQLPGRTPYVLSADVAGFSEDQYSSKVFVEFETYMRLEEVLSAEANKKRHLYEIIGSMEDPVYGMFDVDRHDNDYTAFNVWASFSSALCEFFSISSDGIFVATPGETCQVSDSTRKGKTSLHIKLGVGFKSVHDHKRFSMGLISFVTERSSLYPALMETHAGVYGCVIDRR